MSSLGPIDIKPVLVPIINDKAPKTVPYVTLPGCAVNFDETVGIAPHSALDVLSHIMGVMAAADGGTPVQLAHYHCHTPTTKNMPTSNAPPPRSNAYHSQSIVPRLPSQTHSPACPDTTRPNCRKFPLATPVTCRTNGSNGPERTPTPSTLPLQRVSICPPTTVNYSGGTQVGTTTAVQFTGSRGVLLKRSSSRQVWSGRVRRLERCRNRHKNKPAIARPSP